MNIMDYKYEKNLHLYIRRYFINKSFKPYKELKFYDRRIDIVAYSASKKKIISVEAKLSNWYKAFQQALIYQLCSDWVYIAMPEGKLKCIDQKKMKKEGIGFLAIYSSNRCRELIKPRRSKNMRPYYKKELINRCLR